MSGLLGGKTAVDFPVIFLPLLTKRLLSAMIKKKFRPEAVERIKIIQEREELYVKHCGIGVFSKLNKGYRWGGR